MFSHFSSRSIPTRFVSARKRPLTARPPLSRRRGVALIYTALGLAGFMGITALVVDMGSLYTHRAQAQRAADAAALAGAYDLQNPETAKTTARDYAKLNGYDENQGATITLETSASVAGGAINRIKVTVQRREPLSFLPAMAALLGENQTTSLVGAFAVAEAVFATKNQEFPLTSGAEYGAANGFANPSVFGPDSRYEYGDAYSPKFRNPDSKNPNIGFTDDPAGADFPGYEYSLDIAENYRELNGTSKVQLELFDPDCYVSNILNSIASWDEIHVSSQGPLLAPTTTQYTLLRPERYPGEPKSARQIAQASYGGTSETDKEANLKWTTPDGFAFDLADYDYGDGKKGTGRYSVIAKALSGGSENGFQFRAGPQHEGLREAVDFDAWKAQYNNNGKGNGTGFNAIGKTVFNFTRSGQVQVSLGFVPKNAQELFIDKFDTDVGATSVVYNYVDSQGTSHGPYPGVLSKNGEWNSPPDRIEIPPEYEAQGGGTWYATYDAAAYDTSTWKIKYSVKNETNTTPNVRLVD